jgi:hypothetical protein
VSEAANERGRQAAGGHGAREAALPGITACMRGLPIFGPDARRQSRRGQGLDCVQDAGRAGCAQGWGSNRGGAAPTHPGTRPPTVASTSASMLSKPQNLAICSTSAGLMLLWRGSNLRE